jgi:hypothetical protein
MGSFISFLAFFYQKYFPSPTHAFLNDQAVADAPALWTTVQPMPIVPGDTQSDASVLWVLQKVHECSRLHKPCSQQGPRPLPMRVLDLGKPEWPKESSLVQQYLTTDIKLYEPGVGGAAEQYVCLSHCWGKTNSILRTTSSNIHKHLTKISWSSLPKTFQDAVVFTRKLRTRYLWIDSLCIIQDDKDDWFREAGKMCDVFQDSFLTLCATMAPDCNHGLFIDCVLDELHDSRSKKIETTPWEVYARRPINHSTLPTGRQIDGKSPLLKRGWVYQERLLASRVVHFGPQELIWECPNETTCECSLIDAYQPKQIHLDALLSGSAFKVMVRWHEVVEEYSKLALTFENDRLPALHGLAAQFKPHQTFRYLAGLWEGSLILDLTWDAEHSKLRPEKRQIPTWSWASVTSGVSYPASDILSSVDVLAEVLHIPSTRRGTHPQKRDCPGQITLLGYLAPVDQPPQEERDARPSSRRLSVCATRSREPIYVSADYQWYNEGPEMVTDQDKLFLFLIAKRYDHLYCLVLKKKEGSDDTFERIGITRSYQQGVEIMAFEDVNVDKKSRINII